MKKKIWLIAPILVMVMALVLSGCGTPKLGTEDNPIIMSFVPSGEMETETT